MLVLFALAFAVAVGLSSFPARAGIADGGFESGVLVDPATAFPFPPSTGVWTRLNGNSRLVESPSPVHSGRWSLQVDTTTGPAMSYVAQDFDSGSLSYVLTFWVHPGPGSSVGELIYNWDRTFGKAEAGSQFWFTPEWTRFVAWNATVLLSPVPPDAWHEVRVVADRCAGVQRAYLDGAPWGSVVARMTPPSGHATIILGDAFGGLHGRYSYDDVSFTLFDCTSTSQRACPLTHGFWKNHPAAWPVDHMVLGNETYPKAELLTLLKAPSRGDASLILAHQLIAAKLNIANGSDPEPVRAEIVQADALLDGYPGKLPFHVGPSSPAGRTMTVLSGVLDAYNSGKLTPHCGMPGGETGFPATGAPGAPLTVPLGVSFVLGAPLVLRGRRASP
ncbi:MAG: hypothetical protein A3K65_09800 [Euryarchaeota archaeon RBG_16_68_12]|nr:MAG: hypothetical protein A3K65_09800 [Euryarchaeota archaeon RBG_16_68_12]